MEWNAVYIWHADVRKCKRARLLAPKLWMFRGMIWSPKVTLLYVCFETILSYFNPYCTLSESKHVFMSQSMPLRKERQQRGRFISWLGRTATQQASCYLMEAEIQSRCGRELYTEVESRICSRHRPRVTDCFRVTPGGFTVPWNSKTGRAET